MNLTFRGRSVILTLAILMASTGCATSTNVSKSEVARIKAQVSTSLNKAALVKLSVVERYWTDRKWPNNNDEAKVAQATDTDFTIEVGDKAVVTITYHEPAELAGKTITLTPSEVDELTINWECKSTDISTEYLPKKCQ